MQLKLPYTALLTSGIGITHVNATDEEMISHRALLAPITSTRRHDQVLLRRHRSVLNVQGPLIALELRREQLQFRGFFGTH